MTSRLLAWMPVLALAGLAGCGTPGRRPAFESNTPGFLREDIPPMAPVPQLARPSRPQRPARSQSLKPVNSADAKQVNHLRAPASHDDDVILLPLPTATVSATTEEAMVDGGEPVAVMGDGPVDQAMPMADGGGVIVLDPPGTYVGSPGLIGRHQAKQADKQERKTLLASFGLGKPKQKKKSRSDIGSNNPCFPRELRMASHPLYVVDPPDVLYLEALQLLPNRPVAGERLVRQDGTISLGYYGQLHVAGLTLAEIEDKIRDRLSEYVQNPQVYVDVASFNSKVYYVLGQVNQTGRLPVTGNETVLDAVTLAGGLTNYARKKEIHVARPNPGGGCDQILHVDWEAITSCGDTRTNYQLLPGDRVVIPGTRGFGASVFLDNFLTPVERIAAIGALGRFIFFPNN